MIRQHISPKYRPSGVLCIEHDDCRADSELAAACLEAQKAAWKPSTYVLPELGNWSIVATLVGHAVYAWGRDVVIEGWHGRVVETFYESVRVMSDIWEEWQYATVMTDDSRFIKVYAPEATIDATPEMVAMHAAWKVGRLAGERMRERLAAEDRAQDKREEEARTPGKGKRLRVVRGRKVAKGTTGECMWYGETRWGWRVGIIPDGQTDPVWTDAKNVEVA
jgi:hypothetical protein